MGRSRNNYYGNMHVEINKHDGRHVQTRETTPVCHVLAVGISKHTAYKINHYNKNNICTQQLAQPFG
jgi:hypothetical protein